MEARREFDSSPAPVWDTLLETFDTATAELVVQRGLGHRCDTKFLLPAPDALSVLAMLTRDYVVIPAAGARIASYQTLYFDTPSLASYHAHRRGRRVRHKMRIRHYLDRRLSTLEVKTRRTEYLSTKSSQPHPFLNDTLSADDQAFVATRSSFGGTLLPQVYTHFRRITLVHRSLNERVTFDLDLLIERKGSSFGFSEGVIAEVKQWPFIRNTLAMHALHHRGPGPLSLSKYCAAMALTLPNEPRNRFLPGLRRLMSLSRQ